MSGDALAPEQRLLLRDASEPALWTGASLKQRLARQLRRPDAAWTLRFLQHAVQALPSATPAQASAIAPIVFRVAAHSSAAAKQPRWTTERTLTALAARLLDRDVVRGAHGWARGMTVPPARMHG